MSSSEYPPRPRLSFSQCLIQPESDNPPQKPVESPDYDFDFKVSESRYASSADELFSDGKILPTPLKNPDPNANPNPDPIAVPVSEKNGGKKSLWKFGRSASLNCGGSGMMKIKFLRSYSTGSDPNANPNPMKPKPKHNNRGVCGNGGNRISPVPLFPKEKGVIAFLLCNCVGGGNNRSMEYY